MKSWIAFLSLMCCVKAFSASIWTNELGGFWKDGINWSGGAPTNNADTRITNVTSKTVIIDAATPAMNLNLSRLQLWGPGNNTNSLLMTDAGLGNPLLIANSLTILRGGELVMTNSALTDSGTLIMSNGAVTLASSALRIAGSALTVSAGASMRLNDSSLTLDAPFQSLNLYNGSLTLNGGSIVLSDSNSLARVGRATNASLIINDGTVQIAGDMTLGESFNRSAGLLQMSGGSLILGSLLTLAEASTASGTILMTGGQLVATNGTNGLLRIGNVGLGQMLLSNATVRATSLQVAEGSPTSFSTGIVSVASGQLVVGENVIDPNFTNIVSIGHYGNGQMTVSNGGVVLLPNTSVARHSNSVGRLTVLANGFVGFSDDLSIGRFSGATGSVVVAGGHLVDTNSPIWVGRDGVGSLNITNGLVEAPSLLVAMVQTNKARGTLNLSGGTVLLSSNLVLGDAGLSTGQVTIASGSLIITNPTSTALLAVASGRFDFFSGEITADNVILTNSGANFAFHGGTLHTRNSILSNGVPFVVGDGTNAATLNLVGGTHAFPNGLIISSNAMLTGCGTIIGPITNYGTIATNCGGIAMPPTIAEQPMSQTVTKGATVSFQVTANGDPPLTYQWRFSGLMADIPGATNAILALTNVQPADAGNYRVRVSNTSGSITSTIATLRVLVSPSLAQTTLVGTNFNFSFGTINGLKYTVEYKTNLTDSVWLPLQSPQTGNGTVFTITDPIVPVPARFYRVRVE